MQSAGRRDRQRSREANHGQRYHCVCWIGRSQGFHRDRGGGAGSGWAALSWYDGPALGELVKALSGLGEPERLLLAYEAGPCGYTLARELAARGYRCEVIAIAKIPRKPGERIKTDRRDALSLAR